MVKTRKDLTSDSYIDALLEHVKIEGITCISRISRNRLCVRLTIAEKASQLVNINKYVTVNGQTAKINDLISKAVKVIISNADASISNSSIKKFFNDTCQIKTASRCPSLKLAPTTRNIKMY